MDSAKGTPAPSAVQEAETLVPAAASILDEEIATGILAARDARESPAYRGGAARQPDRGHDLVRNVHEVIDAVASLLPRAYGGAANPPRAQSADASESMQVLSPHAPVRPGHPARIAMKVKNDDTHAVRFVPACTDLLHRPGARIGHQHVQFLPHELHLEPDASADVLVEVAVPAATEPGIYTGLLLAGGLPYLRAIVKIEVA